jgi:hypothetical protein
VPAVSWPYDLNGIEFIGETRMIRQPFASEADRLAYAKWARAVAIVYGGVVALTLFGLVVLGKPLGVMAPDRPADRAVASAAVSGARGTAQPAACRGRHHMGCAGVPAGE